MCAEFIDEIQIIYAKAIQDAILNNLDLGVLFIEFEKVKYAINKVCCGESLFAFCPTSLEAFKKSVRNVTVWMYCMTFDLLVKS